MTTETAREEAANVHLAQLLRDRGIPARAERRSTEGAPGATTRHIRLSDRFKPVSPAFHQSAQTSMANRENETNETVWNGIEQFPGKPASGCLQPIFSPPSSPWNWIGILRERG